jgi:hypothetical protein
MNAIFRLMQIKFALVMDQHSPSSSALEHMIHAKVIAVVRLLLKKTGNFIKLELFLMEAILAMVWAFTQMSLVILLGYQQEWFR